MDSSDIFVPTIVSLELPRAPSLHEIRAGLHTGEIERRGNDISGISEHIAARVAQMGSAGEVIVSSTVKDLVVGSGIRFENRGTHALKGVEDQWRLLSVVA